jgi:ribosomal protein S18 acetylase RimI-like enzyme
MIYQRKLIRRVLRTPKLQWLDIVARDLNQNVQFFPARLPFRFEVLPPDLLELEKRLVDIPDVHKSDLKRRVAYGHICCIAEYEGQVIFTSWIATRRCYSYLLDREIELGNDEAYLYSAYTLPEFRGQGVHPSATTRRLQYLKEHGYTKAFAFIEPNNNAAQRMPAKLGYKKIGTTGLVEVAGIRWYFHRDGGHFSAITRRNYWRKV